MGKYLFYSILFQLKAKTQSGHSKFIPQKIGASEILSQNFKPEYQHRKLEFLINQLSINIPSGKLT